MHLQSNEIANQSFCAVDFFLKIFLILDTSLICPYNARDMYLF